MANLEETREWAEGIYQLEKTDRVLGGTDGVANRQGQQLANRTLWLKEKVESTESALTEHEEADDPHPQYVTEQEMTDYVGTVIVQGQVNADWNATDGAAYIKNKPVLSAVATSGNYADLNGKPTLSAVATSGRYSDLAGTPDIIATACPVGMIYIQYAGQAAPADLFGGTWDNISDTYAGLFFRAEGGAAAAFGETQGGGAPNITGSIGNIYALNVSGAFYVQTGNQVGHGDGSYLDSVIGFSAANANATYGAADEIRPANSTIRIWKRTA